MNAANKLSNIQLELLKVFSIDLSDEQLKEIRTLLSRYFAEKVTSEMDSFFENNSLGEEQIKKWSEEHMRTKYKD